jgi:hypothetical protein
LTRLGELAGEIELARNHPDDIADLSSLIEERNGLREVLRSHAPLSVDDMKRELVGLRSHLNRFPNSGMEMALGEDSALGTRNAIDAIADEQNSADPHSAVVWIRQRIAFLEEQISKNQTSANRPVDQDSPLHDNSP